jgi:hypothetical protein
MRRLWDPQQAHAPATRRIAVAECCGPILAAGFDAVVLGTGGCCERR